MLDSQIGYKYNSVHKETYSRIQRVDLGSLSGLWLMRGRYGWCECIKLKCKIHVWTQRDPHYSTPRTTSPAYKWSCLMNHAKSHAPTQQCVSMLFGLWEIRFGLGKESLRLQIVWVNFSWTWVISTSFEQAILSSRIPFQKRSLIAYNPNSGLRRGSQYFRAASIRTTHQCHAICEDMYERKNNTIYLRASRSHMGSYGCMRFLLKPLRTGCPQIISVTRNNPLMKGIIGASTIPTIFGIVGEQLQI